MVWTSIAYGREKKCLRKEKRRDHLGDGRIMLMCWIHLAQDRDTWWIRLNTVIDFWFP
jgi:hypothetical protein